MCTNMRALELKTEGFTVKSTMKNSVSSYLKMCN
ncbi:unnamed protein product [Oncorhynchus mykiss]|uniref:Uncharacterized protein n=1 Tax=Oncorhynchus mykiss TaxID=8022 RepID=A0A060VT30_ONCMY|nr:unnamed protein product [Oncorhynchus mykiss]